MASTVGYKTAAGDEPCNSSGRPDDIISTRMARAKGFHRGRDSIAVFLAVVAGAVLVNAQTIKIGGTTLTDRQQKCIRILTGPVARELPGDRATRIDQLVYSAWWGLREGLFSLKSPQSFNHCTVRTGEGCCTDRQLQVLEPCPHLPSDLSPASCPVQHATNEHACSTKLKGQMIWQVGMVGALVGNFDDDQVLKAIAKLRYANTPAAILQEVVGPEYLNIADAKTREAILSSQGELRKSYLLRHPAVAVSLEPPIIAQCFPKKVGAKMPSWCITRNDPFASDQAKAEHSLADLKQLIGSAVKDYAADGIVIRMAGGDFGILNWPPKPAQAFLWRRHYRPPSPNLR
jgi:hypothetical protein